MIRGFQCQSIHRILEFLYIPLQKAAHGQGISVIGEFPQEFDQLVGVIIQPYASDEESRIVGELVDLILC